MLERILLVTLGQIGKFLMEDDNFDKVRIIVEDINTIDVSGDVKRELAKEAIRDLQDNLKGYIINLIIEIAVTLLRGK